VGKEVDENQELPASEGLEASMGLKWSKKLMRTFQHPKDLEASD
jgi:hypothetical protein